MVGQADMGRAIREMRSLILGARRLGLLREAHRLGGPELVEKWAALHTVGGKADRIREMAAEANLL